MTTGKHRPWPVGAELCPSSAKMLLMAAGLAVTVAAPAAYAQQEAGTLDEIVVTALRRSVMLQDTPVAVTAFTAEALEARSIDTLDSIARFTPNIRFDGAAALSGGNYNATVFIRGIGQNDFAIFSDPGVGFYVDGVYYARSIGGIMDAMDLQSVEVLRGPQGTLFGKNTIGGAVLINTQRPKEEFGGRIELTTGRFDRLDAKGTLNVPLADGKLLTRLSVSSLNRDGYAKRLSDGQDMGDRNADSARLQLSTDFSEDINFHLVGDITRAREHSAPNKLLAVAPAPGLTGVPFLVNYNNLVAPSRGVVAPDGGRTLNSSFITDSPFTTWGSGPNINDLDLWGLAGTLTWNLGMVEAKSITAYRELEATFARDGDNTPFTYRETFNDDEQWQFSQEFQLSGEGFDGRFTWVGGVYYFSEEGTDDARADLAMGLWPPLGPALSPATLILNKIDNTSYAVFGQGNYKLTDDFAITVGARWNRDKKWISVFNQRQRDNVIFTDVQREGKWDAFTPKVGLEYKPTADAMLYASAGKGFKSGGFNARPLADESEVTQYEPETIWTYEAGAKTGWFDNRLILNAAAYLSKYDNIQLTVNQTPRNFVANAAKGTIKGAELEVRARPATGLDVDLSVGYTDAQYDEVGVGLGPTQILPITKDAKFVKTPKWTGNAGLQYTHALDHGGTLSLRGDLSVYSKFYNDVANTELVAQSGYGVVNSRLTYTASDDSWTLALFATNLTDRRYLVSGNASGAFGLAEGSYGRPREWGVTLGAKF
ncbi:TonB-dependent receptor [Niveispirillum irakense]|uniref:TonB-dependent receptor n=1 Tax=Niveispirillum irakense TaxID=34011 RepID=UPI001AEBC96C|nr:TonB-dependent receptor [Niveispirillum irakense]